MTVDLERSLVELADSLDFPGEIDLAGRVVARWRHRAAWCRGRRSAVPWPWPLPRSSSWRWSWSPAPGPGGRWPTCWASAASPSRPARRRSDHRCPRPPCRPRPPRPSPADLHRPSLYRPGLDLLASTVPAATFPAALGGTAADLADSAQRLGIPPPVPTALGPPAAVTFGPPPPGGELALVWPPSASLPPTAIPGVGALLSVFRAEVNEAVIQKTLAPGTTYERVAVGDHPAVWLAGSPHVFLYRTADGAGRAADAAAGRQHPDLDRRAVHLSPRIGPRPGSGHRGGRDGSGNQLVGRGVGGA